MEVCAYYEETREGRRCFSLQEHLARTAYIAYSLFRRRIEVDSGPLGRLNRLFEARGQRPATMILVLAALLHDVGKASSIYGPREGESRATYPMHEHVSSHLVGLKVLDSYSSDRGSMECSRGLRLVAAVIARHHSAMQCRHPDELDGHECWWGRRRLQEAVAGITRERVLEALPGRVRGIVEDLGLVRGGSQEDLDKTLRMTISMTTSRGILQSLGRSLGSWVLPSVQALTGALIVSDILVAWRERCDGGECGEPDKAYARSWLSELDAAPHLDSAMSRPVEDLLDPVVEVLDEWRVVCGA